jgi:hypothetical protein
MFSKPTLAIDRILVMCRCCGPPPPRAPCRCSPPLPPFPASYPPQGMSYMVAVFLLNMNEFETFVCLANLLSNNRTNMDIYLLHKPAITAYIHCFDYFFEQVPPHSPLHSPSSSLLLLLILPSISLSSSSISMKRASQARPFSWIGTSLSSPRSLSLSPSDLLSIPKALPLEVAARMWDCYLLAGEVFILRGALGLLRLFAARLATLSMEKILPFLAHVPEEALNVDDLMDNIQQATSPVPSLLSLSPALLTCVHRSRSLPRSTTRYGGNTTTAPRTRRGMKRCPPLPSSSSNSRPTSLSGLRSTARLAPSPLSRPPR